MFEWIMSYLGITVPLIAIGAAIAAFIYVPSPFKTPLVAMLVLCAGFSYGFDQGSKYQLARGKVDTLQRELNTARADLEIEKENTRKNAVILEDMTKQRQADAEELETFRKQIEAEKPAADHCGILTPARAKRLRGLGKAGR